jgi:coenzyme F420-reducing hydrogenase gamma subunit
VSEKILPVKTKRFVLLGAIVAMNVLLAGCGPSREEIEKRERARLEQEKEAQKAIRKSNEAVNEVSKKLSRKPPQLDLGLPAEKKGEPPSQKPTNP